MTVSKLARASIITTKRNARTQKIQKFTPHYMCAAWSGEQCAEYFRDCDRQVSANYCIGMDGGIVCNVPEEYRAWTSSSSWNDQRAITVECANGPGGVLTDAAWNSLVKLGADVMRRYGFRPWYTGDSSGTITEHMMFASTDCPGPWLHPRMGDLAVAIKNELDGTKPAPAPEPEPEPEPREPGGEIAMKPYYGSVHRLYNPYNGDHMLITDPSEIKGCVAAGWIDEGIVGKTPSDVAIVYRLYNPYTGEHLVTVGYDEAEGLRKAGWVSEGEPFTAYVGDKGDVDFHRLYRDGSFHLLTADPNEVSTLVDTQGYKSEGVAFSLDRP